MARWFEDPDPYTYERIGTHYTGRPVYAVYRDGRLLGVIEPWEINTDTRIAGTRLRRAGRGRAGFVAVVPNRHSFSGNLLPGFGRSIEQDRRRDAAYELERCAERDEAFTESFRVASVAKYTPLV